MDRFTASTPSAVIDGKVIAEVADCAKLAKQLSGCSTFAENASSIRLGTLVNDFLLRRSLEFKGRLEAAREVFTPVKSHTRLTPIPLLNMCLPFLSKKSGASGETKAKEKHKKNFRRNTVGVDVARYSNGRRVNNHIKEQGTRWRFEPFGLTPVERRF
ncbi:hypothetical protein B0O99DRAFT_633205 [Bisporella sp. PMI_857]|nr:hypothetical protein B0O99DRAFT_633205 [Bisporella sp. PMI_857]